jgi:hypothetical protein
MFARTFAVVDDLNMANILFLGGPWDGEHHEVSADELPHTVCVIRSERLAAACLLREPGTVIESVLYTLRPGPVPAYVAAGWPPPCVVSGCTAKGTTNYTAAGRGRLAGRDWEPGDRIDLCPAHGYDVLHAQGVYGVDQLAAWLRPDARPDALDIAGIGSGLGAEEYAASCARALRVMR